MIKPYPDILKDAMNDSFFGVIECCTWAFKGTFCRDATDIQKQVIQYKEHKSTGQTKLQEQEPYWQ